MCDRIVTIPLEEYEELKEAKKEFEIALKEIQDNKDDIIVIDSRKEYSRYSGKSSYYLNYPPVIFVKDKAKEYIQQTFDTLNNQFIAMYDERYGGRPLKEEVKKELKKNRFLNFKFW